MKSIHDMNTIKQYFCQYNWLNESSSKGIFYDNGKTETYM